jgi:PAS domain S-box-containing protein
MAAIVESSEDAILSVRPDGVITSWNAGAEKLYQYSASEMVGRTVFLLVPPTALAEERRLLERAARGEVVGQYETTRSRRDGSVVDVAVTVSPVRDARENVIGVSKIARDLTRQRQTEAALRHSEEQFRQAQKMEAVGRLAGGVAHDFNNLLSVILSYSNMAIEDLKPGDPLRRDLGEIRKASERAEGLTRQLLAFSRQQVLQPRVIDLGETVAAMERMLQRLLGEDVEFTLISARDLGRVLADPGQIEQVVMNLAVNARDAMPDGGKLTIEMSNVELDATYVSAHFGSAAGSYVMLAVSDTGVGMDAGVRARVFEPFFTTKPVGKGTGLGLATVFGIVQQTGGHVGLYSEPGRGSTFKIYLPRTDRVPDAARAAGAPAMMRGSETILLVEDEEQVRTVACAILRRHGYRILEASNGGEAFLISQDFADEIHLLLTDVVMPRMSGRKLAEQLAPRRPGMRVLFASGYTDDAIVRHGVLEAGVAFIQKPFKPDALLRKVREVLDPRGT